jgi:hypothetical protein
MIRHRAPFQSKCSSGYHCPGSDEKVPVPVPRSCRAKPRRTPTTCAQETGTPVSPGYAVFPIVRYAREARCIWSEPDSS